jgi:hypothetical protein
MKNAMIAEALVPVFFVIFLGYLTGARRLIVVEHEHDDKFGALAEWLALELVPLGIDHLSYLNLLLQDTKQTISIIRG